MNSEELRERKKKLRNCLIIEYNKLAQSFNNIVKFNQDLFILENRADSSNKKKIDNTGERIAIQEIEEKKTLTINDKNNNHENICPKQDINCTLYPPKMDVEDSFLLLKGSPRYSEEKCQKKKENQGFREIPGIVYQVKVSQGDKILCGFKTRIVLYGTSVIMGPFETREIAMNVYHEFSERKKKYEMLPPEKKKIFLENFTEEMYSKYKLME